jgi:hypothetical protein
MSKFNDQSSQFLKGNSILQGDKSVLPSNYDNEPDQYPVLIRKSDLDDIEELEKLITPTTRSAIDSLYNYPKLITLFEKCLLSVTIMDANQKIIGCAIFNDFPQGLTGMIDFKH